MTHHAEPPPRDRDPALLLSRLLTESEQLRTDVADRERRQRSTNVLLSLGIVVVLVMITAVVVLLVQSRQRGTDTRALIKANAEVNQQILDCTTQGGSCYRQGAQRQAQIIGQLLEAQKQISLCQAKTPNDSVADREACIDRVLAPIVALTPVMPAPTPTVSRSPR